MSRIPRIWRGGLAGLLVAVGVSGWMGCVTTSAQKTASLPVHLTVNNQGLIGYAGMTVSADQLGRVLLKNGVSPEQEIRVHLPEGMRNDAVTRPMTIALKQSGFVHVLFMGERHAVSSVGADPDGPGAPGQ